MANSCQTCIYLEELNPEQTGAYNRCSLLDVWDVNTDLDLDCPYHRDRAPLDAARGDLP